MPKTINSRALTSENPCINMELYAPLTNRFFTLHMQDSGQYSINTEEASILQLKLSIKRFTQELCRFGYCETVIEQATLNENVRKII